jgi:AraC-like DNA-binding protein
VGILPLQKDQLVHTADPDCAHEAISGVFTPYELVVVDPHGHFDARLHCHRLIDTAVSFVTYGGEVLTNGGPTSTYFAVLMPLFGVVDFRAGDAGLSLTTSKAAIVSPADQHISLHWHLGSAQLVLRIEQPALEAHLAGLLGECLRAPLLFRPAMHVARGGAAASVHARLRALVREIDRGDRLIDHPLAAHASERKIMTDLLIAQPHNYSDALNADVKLVGSSQVRQAVALMESHPEWQLSVADVATALSISGRSLQRAFRRDLDSTFRHVLRDIRLRRVHDDLRHSVPEATTINDVLARWGLPLQGYTYAAYRHRYHETPAETLHRRP